MTAKMERERWPGGLSRAIPVVLELDRDVSRVLLGGKESQLCACSSRCRFDFGRFRQYSLDDMNLAVGFRECCSSGCDIVEDECAFVHFRQKTGSDKTMREDAGDNQ